MKTILLFFALLAGPVLHAGGLETPPLAGVRPVLILVKGAAGSAEELADIALQAADMAAQLGLEPRVAMLSFSNFGSTRHPSADKVRRAVELARQRCPDLRIDGEMQADTAVVPELIEERFPFSQVKDANVLVFPSLDAANVAYKLMARLGNAEAIGPVLLGLGAPVHVLQAGDSVRDIVDIAASAVMDARGC